MSKVITHTPGPWRVVAVDWSGDGNARFEIKGITRTGLADARLIAAAPALLEACKAALSDDQPYIEKCRAAIAKAEGST